jgi:hypothetical protein
VLAAVTRDKASRKVKQRADGRRVFPLEGSLDVIAVLNGTPSTKQYNYKWEILANRLSPSDDGYIFQNWKGVFDHRFPFEGTGDVVCQLEQGSLDIIPCYLIPTGWRKDVLPAFQYFRAHRELFRSDKAKENQEVLKQLVEDKNPILAIAAWSILDEANLLDQATMQHALQSSTDIKQAVLTHVFLKSSSGDAVAAMRAVSDVIGTATKSGAIEGIELGIASTFHAVLFDPDFTRIMRKGFSMTEVQRLGREVKMKQSALP